MSQPILRTKLNRPPRPANLITRPHLLDLLQEATIRPLTLISAPAGFGKTTLVAEWLAHLEDNSSAPRIGWLSLDAQDNDPALFLAYFVAALQASGKAPGDTSAGTSGEPPAEKAGETIGEAVLSLLQSPQPLALPLILGTLINELTALSEPFYIVLDDYHLIDNPQIHEAIVYLLTHQPPNLRLIMTTRSDPPLSLARLRVGGRLLEVRAQELRFSIEETAIFLQEIWGIHVTPEQIDSLDTRAEGWVAGLQLAALSLKRLQTEEEIANFVTAFTGSHRYVLDYLVDEVLQQQPPALQDFLLRTAVPDRLCAGLCNALLEVQDSRHTLEQLETANLFLISLDQHQEWYRYHHLFLDLLRHRLKQIYPDALQQLHARAAHWYAQNGYTGEAVSHALHAGEPNHAGHLIAQARWDVHGRGELATLRRWLDMLPAQQVETMPELSMLHTWLLLYAGKMQDATTFLDRVEPGLEAAQPSDDATHAWRGELAVLRAQIALNQGQGAEALEYCRRAQTSIPHENLTLRSILASMLGKANQTQGNLAAATEAFANAANLGAQSGNRIATLAGLTNQAALCELQGRLHRAHALQEQALALTYDRNGRALPLAGIPLVGQGKIYREWNRLETATERLEQAIHLGRQAGIEGIIVDGTITLALVEMGQGRDAHPTLAKALSIVRGWQEPLTELRLGAFEARLHLAQNNLRPAQIWADKFLAQYSEEEADKAGEALEIEYTTIARMWLASSKPDAALSLLTRLLSPVESAGRLGRLIEVLALQALAYHGLDQPDQAQETLIRALQLAQPESYVRVFADEGRPMGELLARVALAAPSTSPVASDVAASIGDYAYTVLAAIPAGKSDRARPPANLQTVTSPSTAQPSAGPTTSASADSAPVAAELAQWLAEPLSEREQEVLGLVAQGLTNREIGERLYISLATVKKHMENIHGKLYVNNRTQAVARARELNLL